jgi:hypothetical protein
LRNTHFTNEKVQDLAAHIFKDVLAHLEAKGLNVATSTNDEATIIHAPFSTKGRNLERLPGNRAVLTIDVRGIDAGWPRGESGGGE